MDTNRELNKTITSLKYRFITIRAITLLLALLFTLELFSQSTICETSEPFCTSDVISFPAGGTSAEAEDGPCYDCVSSFLEDPAWFHMLISTPGTLEITMYNDNNVDIDYVCWGPFDDPHAPCDNELTCDKLIDCGSTTATTEICNIQNAVSGKYYILLITNYLNVPCNITFSKTGGTAETDCNIVPSAASNNGPLCVGETLELYAEPVNNATYSWTGPNGFTSNVQNPVIPNVQLANAGIYELIVTLGGNQSNPFPTEVEVYANPVAGFSNTEVCDGEEVQFTDLSTCETPETPIISWDWDFGDGNTSTLQNPSHTYAAGSPLSYNVQLSVETSGGCSNQTTQTVETHMLPTASFDYSFPDGSSCIDSEIQFSDLSSIEEGSITSWNWDFGDSQSSTEQNPIHSYDASGTFTVILTVGSDISCTSSYQLDIYIDPSPVAFFEFSFPDGTTCMNSEVQFSDLSTIEEGNISSWYWDFGDSQTSTEQNPIHSYDSPGDYTVTLVVESDLTCSSSYQNIVTINPNPDIDFSFTEVCYGLATEFNDSDFINVAATAEWLYDFGDGNTGTESNPSHTYGAFGSYEVVFSIVDTNGCSNEITHSVNVFEGPQAAFTYDSVCLYSSTHFTDESSPESEIDFWQWNLGDGSSSEEQNINHIYSDPGIYDVQLIVGSYEGCNDTIAHQVLVWEPPVADFNYSDTSCTNGLIYFNDSSYSNESIIDELTWHFPDGHISFDPFTYFVFLNTETYYDVILRVQDERGCQDTITKNIYVEPALEMNFLADTVCFGQETLLEAFIVKPEEDSIIEYSWNFRDGSETYTTTFDTAQHIFNEPGLFEVILEVRNNNGCESESRKSVKVWENPGSVFSFTESYCNDSSWFYDESSISEGNIIKWNWFYGDGDSLEINAPENPDHYHFYPPLYSEYTVSLRIEDENGCQDSSAQNLFHYPCVLVNHFLDTNWVCDNTTAIFIDSSVVDPDYDISSKTWFFGDGEYLITSPDIDTVFYDYESSGTFHSKLLIEYEIGQIIVQDSSERILEVQASPVAQFNVEEVCLGEESQFINLTELPQGSLKQVFWSFGDGQDTLIDYVPGQNTTGHVFPYDSLYTSKLWVIGNNNCEDSISKTSLVNPLPEIGFQADSTIFCGNATVIFRDTSQINSGFIANRLWTFGDGGFISTEYDTAIHHYMEGTYSVTLENTSDKFCSSMLKFHDYILINPVIEADFEIEPSEIHINEKQDLEIVNYVTDEAYLSWSLSDSLFWENISLPNIADNIHDTGAYLIKQYTVNEFGCVDSTERWLQVYPAYSFYFPTAFSPNNNGVNDTWGPLGKYFDLESYELQIFSRWGEMIFETNDFYEQWDGKFPNGNPAPIGVYPFIIRHKDMTGNNKVVKGTVTLLL